MTDKALLIFTAIVTFLILGVTGIGWVFFVRWYKEEERLRKEHSRSSGKEVGRADKD